MILITGGTGYIGRDLVKEASKLDKIRILTRKNIKTKHEVIKGNILSKKDLRKAMKGVKYVFHLAAQTNRLAPDEDHWKTNFIGTKNVLDIAKENKVKKVVFMSSEAVSMSILDGFGRSKIKAEELSLKYKKYFKIPVIRASYIYDKEKIRLFKKMKIIPMINKDVKIHFAYKKTVVKSLINAMKFGDSELYHVGDKNPVSLHKVYLEIMKQLNKKPIFLPYFLIRLGIGAAYLIKGFYKIINKNPPVTPDTLKCAFQDRSFDIDYSSKKLKLKPVDTISIIKESLR